MKNKITIQEFTNWLFMAEKECEEKFEEKHKKGLNITRIVGLILIICCIPLLRLLLTGAVNPIFWKFSSIVRLLISAFFVFIIIVVYKAWIKSFWDFLKKDSIVHYIFLAIIPAAIIFFGYQHIVVKSSVKYTHKGEDIVQTDTLKNDYDEIIDRLNGFYSTLFAAITVIAAILAIGAWRTIKELKEKLEKFKKIEEDVDFLRKKKDLAEWIQNKFEKDVDKKILTSISFDLTVGEEKKLKEIKEQILNETTDDSWLKIVYVKELLEEKQKNKTTKEDDFIKIENIFNFIENRDLLKEDSEIPELLYHLKALMYWFWYYNQKSEFLRKYEGAEKKIQWVKEWWKEDEDRDKIEDKSERKSKYKRIKLIEESVKYYEMTLDIYKKKGENNLDETLGNLAVVLIELSKFKLKTNDCLINFKKEAYNESWDKIQILKYALNLLGEIKNETFNTHWDKARALYYLDCGTSKAEIDELLARAEKEIVDEKDKKFFIKGIENERKEVGLDGKPGFPGINKQEETAPKVKKRDTSILEKIYSLFTRKK